MKYKFVKIKTSSGIEYDWMLEVDSIGMLCEYTNKVQVKIYFTKNWTAYVESMVQREGIGYVGANRKLQESIFDSRSRNIICFGKIYINKFGGGLPHSDRIEITETFVKNELVFPKLPINVIFITQRPGQNHFYARVGATQVVDENGACKWNTEKQAQRVAEQFLIKENSND